MSLRSTRIDETGIEIVWSDGGSFTFTRQQWLGLLASEGSKAKAMRALRAQLQAQLNIDRGEISQYTIDFDDQGFPTQLEWNG